MARLGLSWVPDLGQVATVPYELDDQYGAGSIDPLAFANIAMLRLCTAPYEVDLARLVDSRAGGVVLGSLGRRVAWLCGVMSEWHEQSELRDRLVRNAQRRNPEFGELPDQHVLAPKRGTKGRFACVGRVSGGDLRVAFSLALKGSRHRFLTWTAEEITEVDAAARAFDAAFPDGRQQLYLGNLVRACGRDDIIGHVGLGFGSVTIELTLCGPRERLWEMVEEVVGGNETSVGFDVEVE